MVGSPRLPLRTCPADIAQVLFPLEPAMESAADASTTAIALLDYRGGQNDNEAGSSVPGTYGISSKIRELLKLHQPDEFLLRFGVGGRKQNSI